MSDVVKEFHRKGDRTQRVRIFRDEYAENPWEESELLAEVLHVSTRFVFPNETTGDTDEIADIAEGIRKDGGLVQAFYLYEHSGVQVSTSPFGCPWDSGQIGFIVIRKETIDKEFSGDMEMAKRYIEGQIETYNAYLSGEVYRWQQITLVTCPCCDHTEEVHGDSVCGYYGDNWDTIMHDAGFDPDEWEEV